MLVSTRGAPPAHQWVVPSRAQVGGPKPGPSGWAQAGPKWMGPRRAQVGPSQKFGTQQKSPKIKILKIKIRSAQNVGKAARSGLVGKKSSWPHLGHLGPFFAWAGKMQKMSKNWLFSLVGQWALFNRFGVMCWCHLYPRCFLNGRSLHPASQYLTCIGTKISTS